eukprot:10280984-Karenia_brevis.AAC.1
MPLSVPTAVDPEMKGALPPGALASTDPKLDVIWRVALRTPYRLCWCMHIKHSTFNVFGMPKWAQKVRMLKVPIGCMCSLILDAQ